VPGDVGQCLGDDEVRDRLDRGGEPVGADFDLHRHRRARRQRRDAAAQSAGCQRRQDPARELAQLMGGPLCVLERLADERPCVIGAVLERLLRQLHQDR
jgi:hypothetical protein